MLEMALAFLALLFPLVVGMIEATRICMVSQLLANAAREGCRLAVTEATTTSADATAALTDVNTRITTMLSGSGITLGSLTAVDSDPGTPGAWIIPLDWSSISPKSLPLGSEIRVVLRVPFSQVDWLIAPGYFNSTNITVDAWMGKQHGPLRPRPSG